MANQLLLCALVIIICIAASKVLYKAGVPALLIFLVLGMICGSDGLGFPFGDFAFAEKISSIALIFIMFYGGIGANWKLAKPVAAQSILLSTLGVLLTAGLTGLFSWLALGLPPLEAFLLGAVVGSTDAASVFSILRSRKLNLKGGLSSMLEIESGSNDPCAYMLTAVLISLLTGNGDSILLLFVKQIAFGLGVGFLLGWLSIRLLRRIQFEAEGLYPIFILAFAVLAYSLSEVLGGNGYLSVYLTGILIGNAKIPHRKSMVRFFDGVSWLAQILLFFTLGLLSFPSSLPGVILPGILLSLFMIFIARPAAVFAILSWFKTPVRQQVLVSWVGLRGAASIVFAIMAVTRAPGLQSDLFHMVFFIALFSVAAQGTLIPLLSRKLKLVDTDGPALRIFNDYEEEFSGNLFELPLEPEHPWVGKTLLDAEIPEGVLIVMIKREGNTLVPNGSTELKPGDLLVLSGVRPEMEHALLHSGNVEEEPETDRESPQ